MTDRKAVIKNADMSEDMQQDAIDCATQALEKNAFLMVIPSPCIWNRYWGALNVHCKVQYREGYSSVYKERIRQEVQSHMALHCWAEFRVIRYTRNKTLHLLLFGPSSNTFV
uniref:Uncharacterized protein n=1 Tax=Setaria digitata TaxID=48799 RepID=A0A915PLK7_9BILA